MRAAGTFADGLICKTFHDFRDDYFAFDALSQACDASAPPISRRFDFDSRRRMAGARYHGSSAAWRAARKGAKTYAAANDGQQCTAWTLPCRHQQKSAAGRRRR